MPCGRSINVAPAHLPGRNPVIGSYLEATIFVAVLEAPVFAFIFGTAFMSVFEASDFGRAGMVAGLVAFRAA